MHSSMPIKYVRVSSRLVGTYTCVAPISYCWGFPLFRLSSAEDIPHYTYKHIPTLTLMTVLMFQSLLPRNNHNIRGNFNFTTKLHIDKEGAPASGSSAGVGVGAAEADSTADVGYLHRGSVLPPSSLSHIHLDLSLQAGMSLAVIRLQSSGSCVRRTYWISTQI